jgi:DNA-binding MurR/RpiR family transcriptional regulator
VISVRFDERIQIYEYRLNDTDDQVIEYVQKNRDKVVHLSIQKLAEQLFIVPNTIVRLAKKLGYEGFAELKLALKKEQDDKGNRLLDISESIKKTYEMIDKEAVDVVVRRIRQSAKVLFYGVGDSLPFCVMMVQNLRCAEKRAEYFMHRHEMLQSAETIHPRDIVFVISATGETKQVLEAVRIAKENGAFVISLTHLCDNTLARIASLNLFCWAPKKIMNHYDVTDRTSMMIILRTLSEHYWLQYGFNDGINSQK